MKPLIVRCFGLVCFMLIRYGKGGCASFPESPDITKEFELSASKDDVWEGVLHHFSSTEMRITRGDEKRGIFAASRSYQHSPEEDEYGECPEEGRHGVPQDYRSMHVLIFVSESDANTAKETINLEFRRKYVTKILGVSFDSELYDCESTGVKEQEIYEEIQRYVEESSGED